MKTRSILENAVFGFEFEFYTPYSFTKLIEILNSELDPIEIRGFRRYHSKLEPTPEVWKIEPDMSGGPNMVELVTGPMDRDMARLNLARVFKFLQEHAFTNDHCSIHINMSFKDSSDKQMAGLSPLKMIMSVDEEEIYKDFPKREGSIYAKSVKRILPVDGLQYVDRQEVLERSLKLPDTKYYGINFSNDDRIEVRYIGGRNYHLKSKKIMEWLDKFFLLMWNSTNEPLSEQEMSQLRKYMDEKWISYSSFNSVDEFSANYHNVKIEVDREANYELLRYYWAQIKDRIYDLMSSSELDGDMTLSYDSRRNKIEVYDAKLKFNFPVKGLDFVSCTLSGMMCNACALVDCEVEDSNIQNSNVWDSNIYRSHIYKTDVNSGTVMKNCFFSSGYMDGQLESGVMRSGQIGPHGYVARQVKKTTAVSLFKKQEDKKKKLAFNDNIF